MSAGYRCYVVSSAGRTLTVRAAGVPAAWWERIVRHLPGVAAGGVTEATGAGAVVLPAGLGEGDVRRCVNAQLHVLHLAHGALCVHAVALQHPGGGGAVLLLGGHGAGKSLVALALAGRGWQVLAGDVAVVDCGRGQDRPLVVGGTSAFIVRRAPVRRWFPGLQLPADGPARLDLAACGGLLERQMAPWSPVTVVAAVVVDVDGDPQAGNGVLNELDTHTAANVWWRASGHLLDRLLDDGEQALRRLEDVAGSRRRLAQVRRLAEYLPLHTAWGAPQPIATHIEALVQSAVLPADLGGR
ncbi:hypothetical protein LN042_19105 [Kitasatospora sp. RB6PN24]|uniref:hypothetical protein n=1 Tax=Kitasatospora humi TaxID=2893891 RepID=UPI001E315FC3|nr:hypothetical protein [Kitasatospora humi]MCC9309166.1 hypothetical protein [Kitasatospora humi]